MATSANASTWFIKGREFVHCNCAYGCPCQFNALPTHGNCQAESMRVLLAGSPTFSCPTVRVPRVQEPRADWLVDGTAVPAELVRAAQLDRYAAHPEWITAGLRRLADRRVLLGLRP